VRAIFTLPRDAQQRLLPAPSPQNQAPPQQLAYVEWFSPFAARPINRHKMYKVQRLDRTDIRRVAVIDVKSIYRSVNLIPCFGRTAPREWTAFNVVDVCKFFYVNPFTDRHTYLNLCYAHSTTAFLFEPSPSIT
jgi:hypothetical protein